MRGRIGAPLFSGAVRIEPQINAGRAGARAAVRREREGGRVPFLTT